MDGSHSSITRTRGGEGNRYRRASGSTIRRIQWFLPCHRLGGRIEMVIFVSVSSQITKRRLLDQRPSSHNSSIINRTHNIHSSLHLHPTTGVHRIQSRNKLGLKLLQVTPSTISSSKLRTKEGLAEHNAPD